MIMKQRTKPYNVLSYEALFRQLQENYRRNGVINSDYQSYYAGYRGETSVDYKLKIIPHKHYLYYFGLRLNNHSLFFQMDTLILTKKFICILEIKNYKERLIYDSDQKQLIQVVDNKEICYKDPILQAETQKMNLNYWLETRGITNIPIETLVISANPSTIISNLQNNPAFYKTFIHAEGLPFRLQEIDANYSKEILNQTTYKKLNDLLLKGDLPLKSNLIEKYGVTDKHFIKGVICTKCFGSPMTYNYGKWHCRSCQHSDKKAHERRIYDYFLLKKDTITNRECRELLQIKSPKVMNKFLKSMSLKRTGNTSATKYHAPQKKDYPQQSSFPNSRKSVLDY